MSPGGLDEPSATLLELEFAGPPEAHRASIVVDDDRCQARSPEIAKAAFSGSYQCSSDPQPAVIGMYRQTVEAAPPSVPGGDQGADHIAV